MCRNATISARARGSTSMPPRRRGQPLPDVRLRHPRTAGAGRSKSADYRSALHHRPLDGRSWRTDLRLERTGPLSFRIRLRADLPPDGLRMGARLFQGLSGPNREETWAAYDAVRLIEEGAQAIPFADRSGHRRRIPGPAVASGLARTDLRRPQFSADPALARRLRSQLSLHRHLHRRTPRLSRQGVAWRLGDFRK
jgi:hypothetical protein